MTAANDDVVVTTLLGVVAWYVVKYCIVYAFESKTATSIRTLIETLPVLHILLFLFALSTAIVILRLQQCEQIAQNTGIAAVIVSTCALLLSIVKIKLAILNIHILSISMCKQVNLMMFVSAVRLFPSTQCISIMLMLSCSVLTFIELLIAHSDKNK